MGGRADCWLGTLDARLCAGRVLLASLAGATAAHAYRTHRPNGKECDARAGRRDRHGGLHRAIGRATAGRRGHLPRAPRQALGAGQHRAVEWNDDRLAEGHPSDRRPEPADRLRHHLPVRRVDAQGHVKGCHTWPDGHTRRVLRRHDGGRQAGREDPGRDVDGRAARRRGGPGRHFRAQAGDAHVRAADPDEQTSRLDCGSDDHGSDDHGSDDRSADESTRAGQAGRDVESPAYADDDTARRRSPRRSPRRSRARS